MGSAQLSLGSPKCEWCGEEFKCTRPDKRFCCDQHQRNASNARARERGKVDLSCSHCGTTYRAYPYPRSKDRKRVYCSERCQAAWKSEHWSQVPNGRSYLCDHGIGRPCPACTFMKRIERCVGWKHVLRADPCGYCGIRPAGGVDHIDAALRNGSRTDPMNMTGCCKRCNETKRTLPLLLALPWVPLSREYHDQRRILWASAPGG